jgi:hypothetical protein
MSLLDAFQQRQAGGEPAGRPVRQASPEAPAAEPARELDHIEQRHRLWQLARRAGFPALRVRAYQQAAGEPAWTTFCKTVPVAWLDAAEAALGPAAATEGAEADGRPLWFCDCGYRCWSQVGETAWYCSNCGRWARGPPGRMV